MAEESSRPIRLMNFISEEQLDEAKKARGERVDDGTAQRDRPLYEVWTCGRLHLISRSSAPENFEFRVVAHSLILKENKDKKDAEFNERFKHRPPKSLDEDETEFLDRWETSRREYERQLADEEAQQLRSFQAAVAAQATFVHELKETPPVPVVQEQKTAGRKNPTARPLGMIIKVQPQAKKAKIDKGSVKEPAEVAKTPDVDAEQSPDIVRTSNGDNNNSNGVTKTGLVAYSDESDEDDD